MMTAALLLAFLQVVPLPEHLFACMPQRAQVVAEWHAAGLPATWRPMSLAPVGTLRAALAMACAMAMWMTCMQLPVASRIALLKLGVLVALPMALLGYAQAGAKADTTGANGLFENRNHFATLMAMLVPFALAAAHDARVRSQRPLALAWLAAMVALLLGAALSYSRAGTVLAFAAAVASLAVVAGPRQSALGLRANGLAIAAAVAVAVTAVAYFAWDKLAQRFASHLGDDLRWHYVATSWPVLKAYLPWGSGFGSFSAVYVEAEPLATLGEFTFAHHAHNELIELAIEGGLPALLLVAAFLCILAVGASCAGGDRRRAAAFPRGLSVAHVCLQHPARAGIGGARASPGQPRRARDLYAAALTTWSRDAAIMPGCHIPTTAPAPMIRSTLQRQQ
jgi:O-antigen ligase